MFRTGSTYVLIEIKLQKWSKQCFGNITCEMVEKRMIFKLAKISMGGRGWQLCEYSILGEGDSWFVD